MTNFEVFCSILKYFLPNTPMPNFLCQNCLFFLARIPQAYLSSSPIFSAIFQYGFLLFLLFFLLFPAFEESADANVPAQILIGLRSIDWEWLRRLEFSENCPRPKVTYSEVRSTAGIAVCFSPQPAPKPSSTMLATEFPPNISKCSNVQVAFFHALHSQRMLGFRGLKLPCPQTFADVRHFFSSNSKFLVRFLLSRTFWKCFKLALARK